MPLTFAAAAGSTSAPNGWLTGAPLARRQAAASHLPILVLFSGTDWCQPCRNLRKIIRNFCCKFPIDKTLDGQD